MNKQCCTVAGAKRLFHKLVGIHEELMEHLSTGYSADGYREEMRICVTELQLSKERDLESCLSGLLHIFVGPFGPLHFVCGAGRTLPCLDLSVDWVAQQILDCYNSASLLWNAKVFSGRSGSPAPARCLQVLCGMINVLGLNYGPR